MINIKNINNEKGNEYSINGDVAILKVRKKDGSIIECKIDTDDLKKVLEKGTWFAEWHKDFNNYLVKTLSHDNNEKHHCEKQTLQSFILNVNTKAPIRHINGNTLDNTKNNLVLFNQNEMNDYIEIDIDTVGLILRDKYGKENGKAIIDKDDLGKVISTNYAWVIYKVNGEPNVVANTPNGRVLLDRLIMSTPDEMIVHHINLNPLDNRKHNLENKAIIITTDTANAPIEE